MTSLEATPIMESLAKLSAELIAPEIRMSKLTYRPHLRVVRDSSRQYVPYNEIDRLINEYTHPDRRVDLKFESISNPDTSILAFTSPKHLPKNIWKNQLYRINGTSLSISSFWIDGRIYPSKQGQLDKDAFFEFYTAMRSAYPDPSFNPTNTKNHFEKLWNDVASEERIALKLLESNPYAFNLALIDALSIPDRLMTNNEMHDYLNHVRSLPEGYRQANHAYLSHREYAGYGECLVRHTSSNNAQGVEGYSQPDLIIPVMLDSMHESLWATATLMFLNNHIEAVHLNHGNHHLVQINRALTDSQY